MDNLQFPNGDGAQPILWTRAAYEQHHHWANQVNAQLARNATAPEEILELQKRVRLLEELVVNNTTDGNRKPEAGVVPAAMAAEVKQHLQVIEQHLHIVDNTLRNMVSDQNLAERCTTFQTMQSFVCDCLTRLARVKPHV